MEILTERLGGATENKGDDEKVVLLNRVNQTRKAVAQIDCKCDLRSLLFEKRADNIGAIHPTILPLLSLYYKNPRWTNFSQWVNVNFPKS